MTAVAKSWADVARERYGKLAMPVDDGLTYEPSWPERRTFRVVVDYEPDEARYVSEYVTAIGEFGDVYVRGAADDSRAVLVDVRRPEDATRFLKAVISAMIAGNECEFVESICEVEPPKRVPRGPSFIDLLPFAPRRTL